MIHTSNSVTPTGVAAPYRSAAIGNDLKIVEINLKDRDGIDYKRWVSRVADGPIVDFSPYCNEACPLEPLDAAKVLVFIATAYRSVFPDYAHVRPQILPAGRRVS